MSGSAQETRGGAEAGEEKRSGPKHLEPRGPYTFEWYSGGIEVSADRDALMELLHKYGPHYQHNFGPDMRARLEQPAGSGGIIGCTAFFTDPETGTRQAASHAGVIYGVGDSGLDIGLFGAVITDPEHRRQGLSKTVVGAVVEEWDRLGGNLMVLGTGSPFAAKTYQKHGFVHLAGGLDAGKKGYNPDDQGEWIMVRHARGDAPGNGSGWKAEHFPPLPEGESFQFEPLSREHWAGLVLLLNAFEQEQDKLPQALPTPVMDGIGAEEAIVSHINWVSLHPTRTHDESSHVVCINPANGRIYGYVAKTGAGPEHYCCYAAPTEPKAEAALALWARGRGAKRGAQ